MSTLGLRKCLRAYYMCVFISFLIVWFCFIEFRSINQSGLTNSTRSVLFCSMEGRKDEELPEVLLGGCRVMEFDLNKVGSAPGSEKEELLENGIAATESWS